MTEGDVFHMAKRQEGDECWLFYARHWPFGANDVLRLERLADHQKEHWEVSGPLADWMAGRGIENYEVQVVAQSLIVRIRDDDLAFEFRMTYC